MFVCSSISCLCHNSFFLDNIIWHSRLIWPIFVVSLNVLEELIVL